MCYVVMMMMLMTMTMVMVRLRLNKWFFTYIINNSSREESAFSHLLTSVDKDGVVIQFLLFRECDKRK